MTIITTRLIVASDGSISVADTVPVGEHVARVEVADTLVLPAPLETFHIDKLPVFDLGPWPEGLSLRREDMYGDDGR